MPRSLLPALCALVDQLERLTSTLESNPLKDQLEQLCLRFDAVIGSMVGTPERAEALRQFALRCLHLACDGALDGAEAQEIALELGLLIEGSATKADCDAGFEGNVGDVISCVVPWLHP